jgi:hypothetical protein
MVQRVITELTDDTTGELAQETLTFGLDGHLYEIDLTEENAQALRETYDGWIDHARRVAGRTPRTLPARQRPMTTTVIPAQEAPIGGQERKSIQKYAAAHGLKVPADRGRISHEVRQAWQDAGRPI